MKKKVFFILNTDDYSGAEAVNIAIIDELKEKYDFYWVSRKGKINNFLKSKNINWIEIKKLSVGEIRRICNEFNPDILHATDYKASVICSLANTGKYIVSHLHHNASWIKKININSIAYLLALKRIKKIITVSESIEKEYIFSKFMRKKTLCIGNPVSRKKVLDKITSYNGDKIYDICCLARVVHEKNPYRFINIIDKMKNNGIDIKAVWIGDGLLKDECVKEALNRGLQSNINFIGFKSNPHEIMQKSKIFVLTSRWEGYGLAAFEALTLGLPCVTSNVGGLPNIVDVGCGMLCDSEKDFIDEITKLLTNSEYYKDKASKANEKSIMLENTEEYMERIIEIYESI